MTRSRFKRSWKFNIEDHLFVIKVLPIPDYLGINPADVQRPFLINMSEDLKITLEKVLHYFQRLYSPEFERHIYLCFSQENNGFLGVTTGALICIINFSSHILFI